MIRNLHTAKVLWSITAALAAVAAIGGIVSPDIYVGLVPDDFLPGTVAQDVLILCQAFALFVLVATTRQSDIKKQVIALGMLGAFFYFYGILTMERAFNTYYLIYAAIFAGSFWSMVYSLSGVVSERLPRIALNRAMLRTSAIVSLVIAAAFTALWIAALVPLMQDRNRIDFLYSIYILDLCFVMPAFAIAAIMSLRGKPLGTLLVPAVMIVGFFVIFPLGVNEAAKTSAGMEMNVGPLVVSFLFAGVMLAIAILHLRSIRVTWEE